MLTNFFLLMSAFFIYIFFPQIINVFIYIIYIQIYFQILHRWFQQIAKNSRTSLPFWKKTLKESFMFNKWTIFNISNNKTAASPLGAPTFVVLKKPSRYLSKLEMIIWFTIGFNIYTKKKLFNCQTYQQLKPLQVHLLLHVCFVQYKHNYQHLKYSQM